MQPEMDSYSDNHLVISKSMFLAGTLSGKASCKYVHRKEFELCLWLAERKNRNLIGKSLSNWTAPISPQYIHD